MALKTGTKSVSATIDAADYDAIEEYRWSVRKNLSQVVAVAISEFIAAHNIPKATAEVAADQPAIDEAPAEKGKSK